jgi:integrase
MALSSASPGSSGAPLVEVQQRILDRLEHASGLELGYYPEPGLLGPGVEEAAQTIAAHKHHRAVWATAMYGGLRRGELMALQVNRIDLGAGVIHVEYGWDVKEGADRDEGPQPPPGADPGRSTGLPARAPDADGTPRR